MTVESPGNVLTVAGSNADRAEALDARKHNKTNEKSMKITIAVSLAVVMTMFGASSTFAQSDAQPSKVTGGGTFLDIGADLTSGSGQPFSFTITLNPDQKADKKSPQAVIHMDGKALREFWGGPLVIKGDFAGYKNFGELFEPGDPKPPQAFLFVVDHPDPMVGQVNLWVFTHDNDTSSEISAGWPDWFGVWIEPIDGNGWPNGSGAPLDDLFIAMGNVIKGNLTDHLK